MDKTTIAARRFPRLDSDVLAADLYDHMVPNLPEEISFDGCLARSTSSILEIACGTGRVGLRFASLGGRVLGIDKSSAMAEVARRKSQGSSNVRWLEDDMRSFDLGRSFGLITLPAHSSQFMLSIPDQISCLDPIRHHLAPNGLAVIHIQNQNLRWLATISANPDRPSMLLLRSACRTNADFKPRSDGPNDATTQTASLVTRSDEFDQTETLVSQTFRGPTHLHCFFHYEMEHLLKRAGLEVQAFYGDFRFSGFTNQSSEMIWFAKARNETTTRQGTTAQQLVVTIEKPAQDGSHGRTEPLHGAGAFPDVVQEPHGASAE